MLSSFTSHEDFGIDPLKIFGRDSIWLLNNADKLWYAYGKYDNLSSELDSIAISIIRDFPKVKKIVWTLQGSDWTHDYPFSQVLIIQGRDTLVANSVGQYPYMMPWYVNGETVYNSKIPSIIGELLPDGIESNKSRLLGTNFNHYLIQKIDMVHIEDLVEFEEAKNKYPRRFTTLANHFEIIDADLSMMGSIEWGGFIAANCLEIVLKDSTISNNIQFSTVFGRRLFLYPTKPLIRNKKQILESLKGNPVYEYCLKNDNSLGEIHFVNHKSFSNEAKREFLKDVKSNGQAKSKFICKFKNAIFFELTENKQKKRSFSRWVFLEDGTIILWQLKGDFLMNLPDEYSNKNGYICRVINKNEFYTTSLNE